jgi:hypothetical protein
MEGSMAGTGKPSIVAAFIVAWGLVGLVPTAAMAQFPIPMIPNFGFGGPQHYRSGSSHYSTHSHSHQTEDKAPVDKTKERDATQPDSTASASTTQRQQQTSSPPPSHDAAPSGGSDASTSASQAAPPKKTNDDQPAFQPSR